MKINDATTRTVRLELDEGDLVEIFIEKTDMLNIKDFKILLMTDSGDKALNAFVTGIALIGDNQVEEQSHEQ